MKKEYVIGHDDCLKKTLSFNLSWDFKLFIFEH